MQLLCLRILHSEQSLNRSLQVGRLLDRWPEWQSIFFEFMVHEVGANEKTLEDIDLKAALPDETPVLQYSLNVHL